MNSFHQYYKKRKLKGDIHLILTTENKLSEISQCIDSSKAAGTDKISERFLKNMVQIFWQNLKQKYVIPPIFSGLFL